MTTIDYCELVAWRERAVEIDVALGELLAAKGDRADGDLVRLQHEVNQLAYGTMFQVEAAPV